MYTNIKVCIKIDNNTIYKFSGKMNEKVMIICANHIEQLLMQNGVEKNKIQDVFELFIETVQNILNYAYNTKYISNSQKEVFCHFSLTYKTEQKRYFLESCNLIKKCQKSIIEEKINYLKNFNEFTLRKLIRQKSRSKEDSHSNGAGLGYIIMTKKSSLPIEVEFLPYQENILIYKQKLCI